MDAMHGQGQWKMLAFRKICRRCYVQRSSSLLMSFALTLEKAKAKKFKLRTLMAFPMLDPEMRLFLEALQGKPSLETMPLETARRAFQLLFKYDIKAEVSSVEDRLIRGPQGDISLRIYQPFGKAPWPVLVYFHGGGWVLGDIETYDATMRLLCQKGILVIAVDYSPS